MFDDVLINGSDMGIWKRKSMEKGHIAYLGALDTPFAARLRIIGVYHNEFIVYTISKLGSLFDQTSSKQHL